MNNNVLTIKEISKKSYDILLERGYSPEYTDSEHIDFKCSVSGVDFSFYAIDDETFGYGAEFKLNEDISASERAHLEGIYLQTDAEDVAFENLHIDGTLVYLSSAFTCDLYDEDMIYTSIRSLTSDSGIAAELQAKASPSEQ